MQRSFFLLMLLAAVTTATAPALAQSLSPNLSVPITITAQQLDVAYATGDARFTGEVKVTQGALTLQANTLLARYTATGPGVLTATGSVIISRKEGAVTETARGDTATFTPADNTLVLTGTSVTLSRGPSLLKGDKLVYNLATQQARMTNQGGPVQATFQAQQ